MTQKEFLALCGDVFERYGFLRHGKHYYLDLESDILGAIFFQSSNHGAAYYLNCCFGIKSELANLPYPKRQDFQMSWRISVPGKERLPYLAEPDNYTTEMIKYGLYEPDEIQPHLAEALENWVIPAIRNGYAYILSSEDMFGLMLKIARMIGKIKK